MSMVNPRTKNFEPNSRIGRLTLKAVRRAEQRGNFPSTLLEVLADKSMQDVATGLRLYAVDGKMGFYTKLLDVYCNADS